MAAPTYVAATASPPSGTTGTITVPWPATHLVGDIGLLFVERAGGDPTPTLSTPNGFAAVTGGNQSTGAGTAGTKLTVFWCRATSTAMASPVVAGSTDHHYGTILTFRGCASSGDPWDVVGGGTKATASTSVTATGVTTTVADTLVVYGIARDVDQSGAQFSAQANASLSGVAERYDHGTVQGGGGGVGVTTGTLATPGATGDLTATLANSTTNAWVTLALRPDPPPGAGAVTKRWDGSAWQTATVKRWDGSAWQTATVQRREGGGWV